MKFYINPGELIHPIKIERSAYKGKDDDRKPIYVWEVIEELYAKKMNVRGEEYYRAQSTESTNIATFYFRYTMPINSKDRIIYDDRVYEILYANDVEDMHVYYEVKTRYEY